MQRYNRTADPDTLEELASAITPGIWVRAEKWTPGGKKNFEQYSMAAADMAIKDLRRKKIRSTDALDLPHISLDLPPEDDEDSDDDEPDGEE